MNKEVIIIGAGGHGKVISDITVLCQDKVIGFLDDNCDLKGQNILGKTSDCVKFIDKYFIIAVGNNSIREKIAAAYPYLKYYTAIHPAAVISDDAKIGEGSCVMAGAVINASAVIGKHCIINSRSVIEHDCSISDYAHISPGAVLCGTVTVGKKSWIGANATVKNNLSIADDVTVGIGAAVTKNIEEPGIYTGIPASKRK